MSSAKNNYRADIDGLRAFAVTSVVLYHAFPKVVSGGFVGVDIFFVISGFLISKILFTEIAEERYSVVAFYRRRVRRIFPALAVCLAAVLAYGFVALMPFELALLGKHVFFGAGFLSNVVLWLESGYFDSAANLKPLLHLWSLGVEEQFYILWPAILWMAFRIKAPMGWLLAVLFLGSFAINIVLSIIDISADFYLPISRFWELLAGAILAWRRDTALWPNLRSPLSWVGLAALVASVAGISADMRFPGWPVLLPVAGTLALILAGPAATINRVLLSNRASVFVGLISYPLYLWHWPLLSYANVVRMEKPPPPLMAIALIAASFLLAWVTYRFIECPVRLGKHRRLRTQIAVACIVALGGCGLTVWANNGFPDRFAQLPGWLDVRKISAAKLDPIYQPTEGMELTDHDTTRESHLGKGGRKVALAGDSVLYHYAPRVQQLADEGRLAANAYFVTLPSCAPVPGFIDSGYARCANVTGVLADLVKRERVQSVVLGANWKAYTTGTDVGERHSSAEEDSVERHGKRLSLNTLEGQEAFYANLEDYVRMLQGLGAKVYLVLGVPTGTRFNPRGMVTRGVAGFGIAPDFDKGEAVADLRATQATADAKLRLIAQHTGAMVLDPFPDICGNGEFCPSLFGSGDPKFSDGLHLRPVFVRKHLHFLDFLLM